MAPSRRRAVRTVALRRAPARSHRADEVVQQMTAWKRAESPNNSLSATRAPSRPTTRLRRALSLKQVWHHAVLPARHHRLQLVATAGCVAGGKIPFTLSLSRSRPCSLSLGTRGHSVSSYSLARSLSLDFVVSRCS
ncbi:hypothetical protein PINS_up022192 [Pythium insidiosum]|nr:hypothetical protein PINS_up022192 [Pythium insidiosum]